MPTLNIRRCHSCQKFHRPDAMHIAMVQFEMIEPKTTEKEKKQEVVLCNDCYVYIKGERKR